MAKRSNSRRGTWTAAALIPLALCALSLLPYMTRSSITGSRTAAPLATTVAPTLSPAVSLDEPPLVTAAAVSTRPSSTSLAEDAVAARTPDPKPSATTPPAPTSTPFSLDIPRLIGVTPTLSDTTPIPTAVPTVEVAPGAINIVVLGSDRRPDWNDWHTDAIQLVSIPGSG